MGRENMLIRSRGLSQDYFKGRKGASEPSKDSFFMRVFQQNIEIANKVLNTKYLDAIQKGILPPNNYGQLTVLDAYYCYRAADTYNTALCKVQKETERDLYMLMDHLHRSYREYNQSFFNDWHIRTSESVNATKEFVSYANQEHHIACSQHPIYTLVAMIPCYYLWYWFSNEMRKKGIADTNLYREWISDCCYPNTSYEIGNFIEEWRKSGKEFDEKLAAEIYQTSIQCELSVFKAAYL